MNNILSTAYFKEYTPLEIKGRCVYEMFKNLTEFLKDIDKKYVNIFAEPRTRHDSKNGGKVVDFLNTENCGNLL